MKQIVKHEVFIHAEKGYGSDEVTFKVFGCDMSEYGYVMLYSQEIDIEVEVSNDFNFTNAQIDVLRQQQNKIQAECQMRLTRIEEQIQSLQCIEYKDAA